MSSGFNQVILVGNLTRDVELRYTPTGTAISKLGLAVNRQWKDDRNQVKEEVTFVDVTAFGKQAETLAQYLKKGRRLLVNGRLKLDQWDDKKTGEKKSKLGVILETFTFLDSAKPDDTNGKPNPKSAPAGKRAPKRAAPAARNNPPPQAAESSPPPSDMPPDCEDDVPF